MVAVWTDVEMMVGPDQRIRFCAGTWNQRGVTATLLFRASVKRLTARLVLRCRRGS